MYKLYIIAAALFMINAASGEIRHVYPDNFKGGKTKRDIRPCSERFAAWTMLGAAPSRRRRV